MGRAGAPRRRAEADALDQPLIAFLGAKPHDGPLGREVYLLAVAAAQAASARSRRPRTATASSCACRTARRDAEKVTLTLPAAVRPVHELRGDEVVIENGAICSAGDAPSPATCVPSSPAPSPWS